MPGACKYHDEDQQYLNNDERIPCNDLEHVYQNMTFNNENKYSDKVNLYDFQLDFINEKSFQVYFDIKIVESPTLSYYYDRNDFYQHEEFRVFKIVDKNINVDLNKCFQQW
jgi:hypothetical protein